MARKIYTPALRADLMAKVCARVATGQLATDAAIAEGTTATRIREWAAEDAELAAIYARARSLQADAMAEEIISLSDAAANGTTEQIQAARLAVDSRKWLVSKIAPRLYGERIDYTSGGEPLPAPQVWLVGGVRVTF